MSKSVETKYFEESFHEKCYPSLRSYFGIVRSGQPLIRMTEFGTENAPTTTLSEWLNQLESLREDWPSLWDFENDLANKVGPLSVRLPLDKQLSGLESYYEDILQSSSRTMADKPIRAVVSEFSQLRGLRLRKQKRVVDNMRLSTNSGSPFFANRRDVTNVTIPCDVNWTLDEVEQILNFGKFKAAAVIGWRGQEGGPKASDVKQRIVWMFPYAVNVCELSAYQPLIESSQRFNLVPAWVSMDAVDRRVTYLFDSKDDDDLIVCTDFSRFDQHFNSALQEVASKVYWELFSESSDSAFWLSEVFPIKYMIPIAYDFGKVKFGRHGMASGSGGTNADETIVHRALQYAAAISDGQRLNPNSQCLGDDGILSYRGCTVERIVEEYTSYGLEMNPDKQYSSREDCVYLRRWHHTNYRPDGICAGVYSTCRALGKLMYSERYMNPDIWTPENVTLRQLAILENVKFHPMREQFIQYCMRRDPYKLGVGIPGFFDNLLKIVKDFKGDVQDLVGYTRASQDNFDVVTGISNWWVVQYLSSQT